MSVTKPHVLLLGAGPTHVHTLARWLERRPSDLTLTLLTPHVSPITGYLIADWVAGHLSLEDCRVPLDAALQTLGVQWIQGRCTGLDANRRLVRHNNANFGDLSYDVVSIDTGTSVDVSTLEDLLPGARGRVLPMRPLDSFAQLWPQVENLANQRTVHLAVVGSDTIAVEMALAVEIKMRQLGAASTVTLVTGRDGLLWGYPARLQKQAHKLLAQRGIHCIAQRCVAVDDGQIYLDTGLRLQCDLPLVNTPHQPAPWVKHSGATLDDKGFFATNGHGQSVSHPSLFATGHSLGALAAGERPLNDTLSVQGEALAHNLPALVRQQALVPPRAAPASRIRLNTGDRGLMGNTGKLFAISRLAWLRQQRQLRRFINGLVKPKARQA